MRKNVAGQHVAFHLVSATDGSDTTTGTPAVYYTIDGGAQGTGTGTVTHEGNGQWSYAPVQAETNGNHVGFTIVLAGSISQTVNVWPVSFDPTDGVRMGLTALPNAAADAAGGLTISDAGGLDLDVLNTNVSAILTDTGEIGVAGAGLTALPTTDANLVQIGGTVQSATDLKDFADAGYDPITNKVQGVVLVDTCTTNTDMRGTDSAALASVCTEARLSELDAANLPADVATILADTGIDGVVISATTANQIADAILNRDMSAVSDTTARSMLNALRFLRNKWSVSGTTLTVTKEDDTTSAWTATVSTDAAADPVTGSDPV